MHFQPTVDGDQESFAGEGEDQGAEHAGSGGGGSVESGGGGDDEDEMESHMDPNYPPFVMRYVPLESPTRKGQSRNDLSNCESVPRGRFVTNVK